MADPAESENQNLLPVQAYFDVDGEFQTFIGQGQPFYATVNPDQSGLHITNSTIDSTTIGATTPSTGVFTNIATTTGTIATAPVSNTDIANKQYVDAIAQGLNPKQAVKCATTANITLSGLQTIDTYTTLAGDRVLVKNQSTSSENGIYIAGSSTWTRATDMDVWSEVPGAYMVVLNGSQGNTGWVSTSADVGTINVTPITFVQFSGTGTYYAGTGLTLAANTFSITNTGVTAATKGSASKTVTATVNAQGQLTSLTDQDIAIAGTQITSGLVSPTVGGTGVNNGANTLTWNASYSLDQSVASGAAPTFTGTNFTGIPNSGLTNSSVTVNGTSIALGASGTITAVNPNALTLGTGLSGTSYDGSAAVTAAIANTGVTANSYTYGSFTVNAQGQLTAASSNATTGTGNIVLAAAPTVSGEWSAFDSVSFNTSATPTSAVGKVYWDGGTTLNIGMTTNVTQKVGEDQFYYIKASSTIAKGEVVMFTGSVGASGVITGAPATGVTEGSYIMGVAAEAIANNAFGLVQSFGILRNINTSGYADGDILWYNPAVTGGLTKVKPSAPNVKVQMAAVVNGGSAGGGVIQIRVNAGSTLGGTDSNVEFGTLNNGDVIVYNSTAGYWQNSAQSSLVAGSATNLVGGVAGAIPWQSALSTTGFTAAGTTGQVLTSNGTSVPTWTTLSSAAVSITDDTTTNATRYPLFADATSGTVSTVYASSTKYQFNPSTGVLTSTSFTGAGTGLTGTATSLSIGGNAATATSATTATNLASGATGSVPYQTSSGSTTFLAAGTNGYVMTLSGGVPTWAAAASSGLTITDDTTTNATRYLTFTSATTGTITGEDVSSTKLQYNPSTGALTSVSSIASGTGANIMPVGTTAQRPATPAAGMFRMNTTTGNPEWYDAVSGTWIIFANELIYSVQYLVVAGGASGGAGSGGYGCGGGGGAGGYLTATTSLTPGTPYTITIGAGGPATAGPGSTAPANPGTAGGNSVFGAIATAIGGGYGGAATNLSTSGGAGGSGGGSGGNASASGSGGAGTSGQGYAGSAPTAAYGSGGGGGASAAATSTINGAAGLNWLSLGTYYAGGGGGGLNSSSGGSGGTGGGGAGGASGGAGTAGTANTGGGGGGGSNNNIGASSGAGGSGIVIIRYLGAQRGSGGTITSSGGYTYHTFTSSSTYTA